MTASLAWHPGEMFRSKELTETVHAFLQNGLFCSKQTQFPLEKPSESAESVLNSTGPNVLRQARLVVASQSQIGRHKSLSRAAHVGTHVTGVGRIKR